MIPAANQIVSSNTGSGANSTINGLSINNFLGANAFYDAGFTGSSARVANVEAGHVWNGHEALTHVTTFVTGPGAIPTPGSFDRHATWVGQAIAGRPTANPVVAGGEYQKGIAHGATLWSGAIATQWTGGAYTYDFDATYGSIVVPYYYFLRGGLGGQTADVINSSWGFGGDSAATHVVTRAIDALARDSGKVLVFAAGNNGGANTLIAPGTAYNVITVAALGTDTSTPPYAAVSDFSSRGPVDVRVPSDPAQPEQGTLRQNVRAKVDLAAPGVNLTLAFYGGTTGGNTGGSNTPGADLYTDNRAGTSFAAPIVAGGATLLVDAGRTLGLPATSADGRVVKAVLLNSATKTAGWNNGQAIDGGVIRTTQSLDLAAGAGRMNLAAALPYYAAPFATRDVFDTLSGNIGVVGGVGWDFGRVTVGTPNDYFFPEALVAGSNLTATLSWFINRTIDLDTLDPGTLRDQGLADLNLQVWRVSGTTPVELIAESASLYNTTEHLSFALPAAANDTYMLRVLYAGDAWNFVGTTSELYGLAWSATPVPEPTLLLLAAGVGFFAHRRYRGIA